jgi:hypothetical protein
MKTLRHRLVRASLATALAGTLLISSGCAVVGAGIGAVAGASMDYAHPGRGALFGAVTGGITGAAIESDHHRYHHRHHHHHVRLRARRHVVVHEYYEPGCR